MQGRSALLQAGKAKLNEFRDAKSKGNTRGPSNMASPTKTVKFQDSSAPKTPIAVPDTPCPISSRPTEMQSENIPATPSSQFAAGLSGMLGAALLGLHDSDSSSREFGKTPQIIKTASAREVTAALRAKFASSHLNRLEPLSELHTNISPSCGGQRKGGFLDTFLDEAAHTPVSRLINSSRTAELSSTPSSIIKMKHTVSLDDVMHLKAEVERLVLVSESAAVGETSIKADIINAYSKYSEGLFALLCAQMSHNEAMKAAELELQSRELSAQKNHEEMLYAQAGEVVAELEAERKKTSSLQQEVEKLKLQLADVSNNSDFSTAQLEMELQSVRAQALSNANSVASTLSDLEEAKSQIAAMASESSRLQAEQDLLSAQVTQLQRLAREKTDKLNQSAQKIEYLTSSLATHEVEQRELRAKNDQIEALLSERTSNCEFLAAEAKAVHEELQAAKECLKAHELQGSVIDKELHEKASQIATLQHQNQVLETGQQELLRQMELESTRHAGLVTVLQSEIDSMQQEARRLQEQVAAFRSSLEDGKIDGDKMRKKDAEIQELQDQVAVATAVADAVQKEMQAVATMNHELHTQLNAVRAELVEVRSEQEAKLREIESLKLAVERSRQKMTDATAESLQLSSANQELQLKLAALQQKALATKEEQTQLNALQSELRSAHEKVADLRRREEEATRSRKDAQMQLEQYKNLLDETAGTITNLRESHAKSMEATRLEHDKALAALRLSHQNELMTTKRQQCELEKERAVAASEQSRLRKELDTIEVKYHSLEAETKVLIEKAFAEGRDSTAASNFTDSPRKRNIRDALFEAETRNEALQSLADDRHHMIIQLEIQLGDVTAQLRAANLRVQAAEEQALAATAECSERIKQLQAMQSSSKCAEVQVDDLTREFMASEAEKRDMQERLTGLSTELAHKSKSLENLQSRVDELSDMNMRIISDNAALQNSVSAARRELIAQRNEHWAETDSLAQEMAVQKSSMKKLQHELADAQSSLERALADRQQQLDGLASMAEQKSAVDTMVWAAQQKVHTMEAQLKALTRDLHESKDQADQECHRRQQLEIQLQVLNTRLANVGEIASKTASISAEIQKYQALAAEKELETVQLRSELATAQQNVHNIRRRCNELNEELQKSETKVKECQNQLAAHMSAKADIKVLAGHGSCCEHASQLLEYKAEIASLQKFCTLLESRVATEPKPAPALAIRDMPAEQPVQAAGEDKPNDCTVDTQAEECSLANTTKSKEPVPRVLRKMRVKTSGEIEFEYGSKTPAKAAPQLLNESADEIPGADARRLYRRLVSSALAAPQESLVATSSRAASRSRFDLRDPQGASIAKATTEADAPLFHARSRSGGVADMSSVPATDLPKSKGITTRTQSNLNRAAYAGGEQRMAAGYAHRNPANGIDLRDFNAHNRPGDKDDSPEWADLIPASSKTALRAKSRLH